MTHLIAVWLRISYGVAHYGNSSKQFHSTPSFNWFSPMWLGRSSWRTWQATLTRSLSSGVLCFTSPLSSPLLPLSQHNVQPCVFFTEQTSSLNKTTFAVITSYEIWNIGFWIFQQRRVVFINECRASTTVSFCRLVYLEPFHCDDIYF